MTKMHIGPVVNRAVLHAALGDSLVEAARQMDARKVGSAIVMTEGGPGIITERDILRAVAAGKDLNTTTVEEFMTHNAITAFEDWDLREAAQRMSNGGFRHLIVLDSGGQVAGVLSMRDLMMAVLTQTSEVASK